MFFTKTTRTLMPLRYIDVAVANQIVDILVATVSPLFNAAPQISAALLGIHIEISASL